jgi:hypothetical protein
VERGYYDDFATADQRATSRYRVIGGGPSNVGLSSLVLSSL